MNESQFSREIRKSLDRYGYFRKMIGGAFVVPGIPDILGCYKGKFIGIECKQIKRCPVHKSSLIWKDLFPTAQIENLTQISASGGLAYGFIELAYLKPHQTLVLTIDSLLKCNTMTAEDLEGLLNKPMSGPTILTRGSGGVWNIEKLLNSHKLP